MSAHVLLVGPPVSLATQATAHLDRLHVSLLRIFEVAYRMVQVLLVDSRVLCDALLELADLRVGGGVFGWKAERHVDFTGTNYRGGGMC